MSPMNKNGLDTVYENHSKSLIFVDERSEETTLYSGRNHPPSTTYLIKHYYKDTGVQKKSGKNTAIVNLTY